MKLGDFGLLTRGGYALADQILSSGTNFATAIIVARLLGPADYGSFAFAYGAWIMVMGFMRSMITNPYMVKASSLGQEEWLTATRSAAGLTLGAGLLGGAIVAVIGFSLGLTHSIGQALVVISFFFPALALQDFWRFTAFCISTPSKAFFNDAFWALVQAMASLFIWLFVDIKISWMIVGWGAGALAGAIFGLWQFQTVPVFGRQTLGWLRKNASLSGWFGLSSFLYSAGTQAVAVLITAIAGRAALGGIQSVNNLFGPAQLISRASETIGLPMASKAKAESGPSAVRRIAFRYTLLVGLCLTAYAALILNVGPFLLSKVFGKAFSPYGNLVIPLALAFLINSWSTGAHIGLMASAAGRQLAQVGLLTISTQVVMIWLLASRFGVVGATWGLAFGVLVRFFGIWLACLKATYLLPEPASVAIVASVGARIKERKG